MRGAIEVEVGTPQEGAVDAARSIPAVAKQLDGKEVKKVIFVPGGAAAGFCSSGCAGFAGRGSRWPGTRHAPA